MHDWLTTLATAPISAQQQLAANRSFLFISVLIIIGVLIFIGMLTAGLAWLTKHPERKGPFKDLDALLKSVRRISLLIVIGMLTANFALYSTNP